MAKNSGSLADVDRRIVAALQRDGRLPWARVAAQTGVSESTAARRGTRLLNSGAVTIAAIPDPLRTGLGHPVLVALSTVPGQSDQLAWDLAARSDVRFVGILAGETDVLAEVVVPSVRDIAGVVFREIADHPAVRSTRTETVLHTVKVSYDWTLPNNAAPAERGPADPERTDPDPGQASPATIAEGSSHSLDALDSELVLALNRDGRSTYSELAAVTGLTEAQVSRRVTGLVERRAIVFATLLDPAMMGYEVEAFVYLKVELRHLRDTSAALAGQRGVRYLALTAGRFDIVAEVVLRDISALLAFQLDVLAHLPGLRDHYIEVEVATVKRAFRVRETARPQPRDDARPIYDTP